MRIWLGAEKEGSYKGITTLFVEEEFITEKTIRKVISLLKFNSAVRQLYFGAGKINIINIDKTAKNLLLGLRKNYILSVEQSITMLSVIPTSLFTNVIGRVDTEYLPTTVKLDSGLKVYSAPLDTFIVTDLHDVDDGMYASTDEMLYKED